MSKPTTKQIQDLEKAHKLQFVQLVNAANFWSELSKKYNVLKIDDPRKIAVKKYTDNLLKNIGKWLIRQKSLERGGVPVVNIGKNSFFRDADRAQLNKIVSQTDATNKGMGWIPLLIWSIVALSAFFTGAYITDELVETNAERKSLLLATSDVAQQLNLTPEQAQQLINKQTEEKPGLFDQIFSWKGLLIAGVFLYFNKPKMFNLSKQ